MPVECRCRLPVTEKVLLPAVPHWEKVVVQVYEFLIKTRNTVQVHLYRSGVEHRQKLRRNDVTVEYDLEPLAVSPLRHLTLPRHDQEYVLNEREMGLNAPEEILQGTPVPEMLAFNVLPQAGTVRFLPDRIKAVYICYDCIHPMKKILSDNAR